jgi:hypothetical protein
MRRILLACLLACGLAAALPLPAAAQLREGLYTVEGQNPDGTTYQGMLEMRVGSGNAWLVAWQIGELLVQGVGVIQSGVLAVGYSTNGQVGVATYEVQRDGKLSGYWTIGAGVGTEILTPRN